MTLLRKLVGQRRLTREEVRQRLIERATRIGIDRFNVELRQLDRWLSGALKGLPHPAACRVLEAEFGHPVERLLAFADDEPEPPVRTGVRPVLPAPTRLPTRRPDQPTPCDLVLEGLRLRLAELTAQMHDEIEYALVQLRASAGGTDGAVLPLPGPGPADLARVVTRACEQAGVNDAGLRPLPDPGAAAYLLPEESMVARVACGPGATVRSRISVVVTTRLAAQGIAATAPAATPSRRAAPIVLAGPQDVAVTFWPHHRPPEQAPVTELASLLRALHRSAPPPGLPLPSYRPMAVLGDALADPASVAVLGQGTHGWLRGVVSRLRARYERLRFPLGIGLIHGAVRPDRLVRDGERLLLDGWDSVCVGPREVDLVPVLAGLHADPDPDVAQADQFAAAYGWDPRQWRGYETLRAIHELDTLAPLIRTAGTDQAAADELARRVAALWDRDPSRTWHA